MMSSTLQFSNMHISSIVVVQTGRLCRNLSSVELEKLCVCIKVYVDSSELFSVFQNGS